GAGGDRGENPRGATRVGPPPRSNTPKPNAAAHQCRSRLPHLTGLPATSIRTSTKTIPPLPVVSQADDLAAQASEKSFLVKVAESNARTREFKAQGDRKQLYPTVDLAGQYALLARYNNYDQFFKTFERNNLSIGVV